MVDLSKPAEPIDADQPEIEFESDFSPRKVKIATAVLLGQTFATSILPYSAFSLVMLPITKEFGWSREAFSFATTFLFIFGAVSLWPIGRIADRVGVRPVILTGTAIVGLVTFMLAMQTSSLIQLYIAYALLGIFGSTGVAYTKVIAALFTQNRGKAMAILGAESTVAMALIPLITNWLLEDFGWRGVYWAFGVVILLVVPVLYFTLEEPGATHTVKRGFGRKKAATKAAAPPPPPPVLEGETISEALRDWVFWLTVLAALGSMIVFNGMLAHMVPALIGKGFDTTTAAGAMSASMMIGVAGTVAGGYMVDRFETAKVAVPFSLMSAGAGILLLLVTSKFGGIPLLMVVMGLNGFAFASARPMGTYFQTRFFGLKSFTEISSVQFTIINPIAAFAAPLFGYIYDTTHSYNIAFILMAVVPLLSAAMWMALPKYRYAADIGKAPPPKAAED